MSGSSLEADHALISPHTLLGYIHGLQKSTFEIRFDLRESWLVGTALEKKNGTYYANDFDHLVDSPLLLGESIGSRYPGGRTRK